MLRRFFPLFVAFLLLGLLSWGAVTTYDAGMKKGLDNFHNLCYNVGGYVINEQRQVIVCKPLSTIPKEEYDKNFKGDRT